MRRRDALIAGGAVVAALALPQVLRRVPSRFEFEPLPGFEGFRRMTGGRISGGVDPLVGLAARLPDQAPLPDTPLNTPCLELFGPGGWGDKLPVAIFSDFNCPYCKLLEAHLMALRGSGAPLRLIWHEMPLLGPSSTRSARAVLAARFLGAEDAARAALKAQGLRPGPVALRDLAKTLGLQPEMLVREFEGARVTQALSASLDLGSRLGIPGTPGTMIGRTLVIGAIKDADIKALVALERETPREVCV